MFLLIHFFIFVQINVKIYLTYKALKDFQFLFIFLYFFVIFLHVLFILLQTRILMKQILFYTVVIVIYENLSEK